MNNVQLHIACNCFKNNEMRNFIMEVVQPDNEDIVSQMVVAYQLYYYYQKKYSITREEDNEHFQDSSQLFMTFMHQKRQRQNNKGNKLRDFMKTKISHHIAQMFAGSYKQIQSDALSLFQESFVNEHLHPAVVHILVKKLTKILATCKQFERENYFCTIACQKDNLFCNQVLACEVNLFELVYYDLIDTFKINKTLYEEQIKNIEKFNELDKQYEQKFSEIYSCVACRQKMVRFTKIQTKASDEIQQARFTCHNPSCQHVWIR